VKQAEIFCLPKYRLLFSFHSWRYFFFCPYKYKPHIDRPLCKWWKVLLLCAICSGMETYICLCEHGLHTQTYASVYTAGPTCPSAKFHITVLHWVLSVVVFLFRYGNFKTKQCTGSLEPWLRKWRASLIKRKTLLLYFFQTITWLLPRYWAVQSFRRFPTNAESAYKIRRFCPSICLSACSSLLSLSNLTNWQTVSVRRSQL